jgi:hypothetical protein
MYYNSDIIALTGVSGAGKDTVAGILAEQGYRRIAFATRLRRVVYAYHGWCYSRSVDKTFEMNPQYSPQLGINVVPQDELIAWGAAGRTIDPDCWILPVLHSIKVSPGLWVITDLRQPNEYAAVKAMGGQVWRVHRDNPSRPLAALDYKLSGREAIDIYNNGSVSQLRKTVLDTLEKQS